MSASKIKYIRFSDKVGTPGEKTNSVTDVNLVEGEVAVAICSIENGELKLDFQRINPDYRFIVRDAIQNVLS